MKDVFDCRRFESNANKSKLPEERPRPGFLKATSEGSKHQQVPSIISTPDPDELVIPPNHCNMEKTNPSPDYVTLKNYPARSSLRVEMTRKEVTAFIKPRCSDFRTQDVIKNDSFTSGMAQSLPKINEFVVLQNKYSLGQSKKASKTALSQIVDKVKKIHQFDEKLNEASQINIDVSQGTERLRISSLQSQLSSPSKQALLTQILTKTMEIKHFTDSSDVTRKTKKRLLQQSQRKTNVVKDLKEQETKLCCYNSEMSWENAFLALENNRFSANVSSRVEIKNLAAQVESSFIIPMSSIVDEDMARKEAIIELLLLNFPIMRVTRVKNQEKKDVLIDVKQLVLDPECFSMLFEVDDSATEVSSREQEELLKPVKERPTQRLGRQPLWLKYPEIVPSATDFIKQQSFAAHARRRESTGTGTGVTLRDLKQHLLDTVPGLKDHGISVDTVHHLMVAPRKNSSRADRYKGLIDAKVAAKKNNYREGCDNQHFLFARVNYREELCSKFQEEVCFYSSDDMNKLRMGPSTAVSRYHQQNCFFMRNDTPNLWDHDFPHAGYLITTSGYQMQVKEEVCDNQSNRDNEIYTREDLNDYSINPDSGDFQELNATAREVDIDNVVPNDMYKDKIGRLHLKKDTYGPALLVLRAAKFTSSSGQTHANDNLPILTAQVKEGKTVAFVKVDNGSDWSVRSVVNSIYLCQLWKD